MMRPLLILAAVGLPACDGRPSDTSETKQLIEAVLESDLIEAQSGNMVCVQRELGPALKEIRELRQMGLGYGAHWIAPMKPSSEMPQDLEREAADRLNRALNVALAGKAREASVAEIRTLPKMAVLFSSASGQPSPCEKHMPKGLESPKPDGPEIVSMTRPVFVDEIAFVEYGSFCGGLCWGSQLKALEKQNGKWNEIAWSPISVG